ncbi:hypothetical protein Hanom_Chr16g01465001 [Helianthus anomalus]
MGIYIRLGVREDHFSSVAIFSFYLLSSFSLNLPTFEEHTSRSSNLHILLEDSKFSQISKAKENP